MISTCMRFSVTKKDFELLTWRTFADSIYGTQQSELVCLKVLVNR